MKKIHTLVCANIFILLFFFAFTLPAQTADSPGAHPSESSPQDTKTFNLLKYRGKSLVLFLYSIDDPRAADALAFLKELYEIRTEYNFEVAALCSNADRPGDVNSFNLRHGLPCEVFLDHGGRFSKTIRVRGGIGLCVFNKESRLQGCKWGAYTPVQVPLARTWRTWAAKHLKFPHLPDDAPALGIHPPAPLLRGTAIDGTAVNSAAMHAKKPLIITIFSPSCPHCRDELDFLSGLMAEGDLKNSFSLIAISRGNRGKTAELCKKNGYGFPVLMDTRNSYASLFPSFVGSIPMSFVVDKGGNIVSLHTGFSSEIADLYRMELRKLTGRANQPLLVQDGYSGEMRCLVCHEQQHIQWSLTGHAHALLSLIRKGKEDDPSCIACHVTGYGQQGGYGAEKRRNKYLRNVQCESCHGPGYISCSAYTGKKPEKKNTADWKKVCITCHTQKESLNFVLSKRLPRVMHFNAPDITQMTVRDRVTLLEAYRRGTVVFDNPSLIVGAGACRECHPAEYKHWKTTMHARVHHTKAADNAPSDKIFRYTTGMGHPGGYPENGRNGVQCEACHGPGERHLEKPDAEGQGYIISLKDQCSSCVVEQICRNCHTPEDDPGFVFETAIDQVRHHADNATLEHTPRRPQQ